MSPRYRSRVSNATCNAVVCDDSEVTGEQIDQEVRKLLDDAYRLARTTLLGDRDKLEGIAKGLLQYETLDSSQIKEIVEHGRLINPPARDRKSTRLNSSHRCISYAVFCLKKKKKQKTYIE